MAGLSLAPTAEAPTPLTALAIVTGLPLALWVYKASSSNDTLSNALTLLSNRAVCDVGSFPAKDHLHG